MNTSMNGGETMEQEQKWIRAIQRRNSQDAAEQLIQSYYDEIYRFVCRQTGSKEDDMDLTQSIFRPAGIARLPGGAGLFPYLALPHRCQQDHRHPPEAPASSLSHRGNGTAGGGGLCGSCP